MKVGGGILTINDKSPKEYLKRDVLVDIVNQPMSETDTLGKLDITCKVTGGGLSGQAGATLRPGDLLLLHAGAPAAVERLVSLAPRLAGAESARDGARIVARALAESGPERTDACVLLARVTA